MATLNQFSLLEQSKSWGRTPNEYVNMLVQTNDILNYLPFLEGNESDGHSGVSIIGASKAYWKAHNEGVIPSTATTTVNKIECKMLESRLSVSLDLCPQGEPRGTNFEIQREEKVTTLGKEMAKAIIYGAAGTGKRQPKGLSQYYNKVSSTSTDPIAENVIDGGGTGSDNTSVWFVAPSDRTFHLIYPKESKGGLQISGIVQHIKEEANGAQLDCFNQVYKWHMGLFIANWKNAAVRVCNLDASNLNSGTGAANLANLMIKAVHKMHETPRVGYWLMNGDTLSALDTQIYDSIKDASLSYKDFDGKKVMHFRGYPILRCDAIINNEARIV